MSFSTLRPCLTKFYAGSEQPLVCVVINNTLSNRQKQQYSLSCIWEMLNAGKRVSKLSFKILLAESYLTAHVEGCRMAGILLLI